MDRSFLVNLEALAYLLRHTLPPQNEDTEKRARLLAMKERYAKVLLSRRPQVQQRVEALSAAQKKSLLRALEGTLTRKSKSTVEALGTGDEPLLCVASSGEVGLTLLGREVAWLLLLEAQDFEGRFVAYQCVLGGSAPLSAMHQFSAWKEGE